MEFDIAIVGGGPAGYVAALHAARLGLETVCIDRRETFGGTCLHEGCIPSKALLKAAEISHAIKDAKSWGFDISSAGFDFSIAMQRVNGVIDDMAKGIDFLMKNAGVKKIRGTASLTKSSGLLEITLPSRKKKRVTAANIIVATGSDPIPLHNTPFDVPKIISSENIFDNTFKKLPSSLTIIGGGVVGLEMATICKRLGSSVVVVEASEAIGGANGDKDASKVLKKTLENYGITFFMKSHCVVKEVSKKSVIVEIANGNDKSVVESDCVLVAIGRRANTSELKDHALEIQKASRGEIVVDDHFRVVSDDGVIDNLFAIGDVIGGKMLAHKAIDEALCVVNFIANKESCIDYVAIPSVIYTDPEVASVGLTEEECAKYGLVNISVGKFPMAANSRSKCMGDSVGFAKVVVDNVTRKLLGMHLVGYGASELIHLGVLCIKENICVDKLAEMTFVHPSIGEAIREALWDSSPLGSLHRK